MSALSSASSTRPAVGRRRTPQARHASRTASLRHSVATPSSSGSQRKASSTYPCARRPVAAVIPRAPRSGRAGRCAVPERHSHRERAAPSRLASTAICAAVQLRTSSCTSASPMPLPSKRPAPARPRRGGIARTAAAAPSAGMPVPVSRTVSVARSPVGRGCDTDRDLALERELEGVREQIEDDLLPHVAVDIDRLRQRRASTISRSPALSIAERKFEASSAVSAARSVGS